MSINKPSTGPSLIYKAQYVLKENVSTFQKVGASSAIITLVNGVTWNDFYGTPATIKLSDKYSREDAGKLHTHLVELSSPGNDPLAAESIANLEGRPILLLLYYQDGSRRVVGDLEIPAIMANDFETSDRTIYSVGFNWTSTERSRYVYDSLNDIPA